MKTTTSKNLKPKPANPERHAQSGSGQTASAGSVPELTTEQAVIISAYTGYMICKFSEMHEAVEKALGRPVWTHEFPSIMDSEIRPAFKERFIAMAPNGELSCGEPKK